MYDYFYNALLTVYQSSVDANGVVAMTAVQQSLVLAQDVPSTQIRSGDWNGDGRTDLYVEFQANPKLYFAASNGTIGQPVATTAMTPYATGDFDGDGRTDMLVDDWQNNDVDLYFSTGSNLQLQGHTYLPLNNKWLVADFNGDGLDDVLSTVTTPARLFLSRGDGTFTQAWSGDSIAFADWPTFAAGDWNNDGRADFSYSHAGVRYFLVSTGNTSTQSSFFASLTSVAGWNDVGLSAADFNGDGLTDVWPTGAPYYTSTNSSFDVIKQITSGLGAITTVAYQPLTAAAVYTKGAAPTYPLVSIQNTTRVVASVTSDDGVGGQRVTSYSYQGAAVDVSRLAGVGFKSVTATDQRTGMRTLTQLRQDFPYVGMPDTITRSYVVGVTETVLEQTSFTYNNTTTGGVYFPFASNRVTRSYELNGSFVSRAETASVYDAFGNPTSQTASLFDVSTGGTAKYTNAAAGGYVNATTGGVWLIGQLICQRVTSTATGETAKTRTAGFEYDASGLVHKEALEPTSASISEASGVADCVTAGGSDATLTVATTYGYDAFGNRHTVTVDDLDASGGTIHYAISNLARTTTIDYGELTPSTYGAANPSNTIAASNGRFPVKVTNAKGHIGYVEYDGRFGAVRRDRTVNGQNTYRALDDFGRPTNELRPDGSQTNVAYAPCTATTCGTGGKLKSVVTADGEPRAAVINDFLGREIMTLKEGYRGAPIMTATEYDNKGFVSRRSLPYLSGETLKWVDVNPADSPRDALGRVTHRTQPGASGAVIDTWIVYSPLAVVTTDDKMHATTQHFTVRGALADAVDAAGTTTQYWYDALGNLRQVKVNGNTATQITNTFDLRGRKRDMTDPDSGHWTYEYNGFGEIEEQTDGKSPAQTTNLTYDVLGRLVQRDDAVEGTTQFTYDTATNGLGLIAQTTSAEGETKAFAYDTLSRARAINTTISGTTFTTDREYDAYGRPLRITYPLSTAYPAGMRVRYDYNADGYLSQVHNDDAGNALIWQLNDATLDLTDTTLGNGVHTTRTFTRETGEVARIRSSSPAGTYDIQDLSYTFDTAGNLAMRKDERRGLLECAGTYQAAGGTCSEQYDALDRLTRIERVVGTVSQPVKTYTYDPLGNLTQKTGIGTYDYVTNPTGCPAGSAASGPHAVKKIGSTAFCYDADGNQVQGYNFDWLRTRTLTWTSYNKPKTLTEGGQTLTFSYGADRSRFKQVNTFSGQTKLYIDGLYERETIGAAVTHVHYIYAAGEAVALYKSRSNGTYETQYLHRDHLGSVVEITNGSAQILESLAYDAWGRRRNAADWSDPAGPPPIQGQQTARGHTGHEQLDDVGLTHMNGRIYDPALGRVLSADPYVPSAGDSQSFNRYAYVRNSPLKYTDPSGYCTASGSSCPAGGFVGGLGGSLPGISAAAMGGSFSVQVTAPIVAYQWISMNSGFGSLLGSGPTCFMAGACGSPYQLYEVGGAGSTGFGTGMSVLVSFSGTVTFTDTYMTASANPPENGVSGQGWFSKLFGRNAGSGGEAASPMLRSPGIAQQPVAGWQAAPFNPYTEVIFARIPIVSRIFELADAATAPFVELFTGEPVGLFTGGYATPEAEQTAAVLTFAAGSFGAPAEVGRALPPATRIVANVARAERAKGVAYLSGFLSDAEQALLASPGMRKMVIGTAVHRATDAMLGAMYPGRFTYFANRGMDFLDKTTGELVELTTRAQRAYKVWKYGVEPATY